MERPLPLRTPAFRLALVVTLAGLAACHPKSVKEAKREFVANGAVHVQTSEAVEGPVTVSSKLDCPEQQGELKRVAQAADGQSCSYQSTKGVVDLSLMPDVADNASATLAPLKARLDAMLPGAAKGGTVNVVSEVGPDGEKRENVDLPFLHVRKEGKHSHVRILGMTVDSDDDDKGNTSDDDDDAPPKTAGGSEFVYVLASGTPSSEGYHAVGYVARGARTGPLVVGVFKYRNGDHLGSSSSDRHHDDSDLDALMDLNAKKGAAPAS